MKREKRNWRQSYQEMFDWHMEFLEEQPNMRVEHNLRTRRAGDMSRSERLDYCRRQAEKDVNRAIHDYNRNLVRSKQRAGEAQ